MTIHGITIFDQEDCQQDYFLVTFFSNNFDSNLVMKKSPVFFKVRALGLTRALKLITRAFLGFAHPIDFTNVADLISLYSTISIY